VPSQVALPLVGAVQAVHEVPQVAMALFETQAPLQLCVPVLQVNPHVVPSQVAVAPLGAVQGVQRLPQL
jgi:hypothetical protein